MSAAADLDLDRTDAPGASGSPVARQQGPADAAAAQAADGGLPDAIRSLARRFNRLSLRRGITLEGLGRDPHDLEVFFDTVLLFVTDGAELAQIDADGFAVRLSDFLARHAGWLKTDAAQVTEMLAACGRVVCKDETCRMSLPAVAPDATLPGRIAGLWRRLDDERARNRARIRARLQEKNRTVNASRKIVIDERLDALAMDQALRMARLAAAGGEVPVGAVVVVDGNIVAAAGNEVITRHDPTAHAEILALRKAAALMGNERLAGATLYVTLEPCPMCAAAAAHARVDRVVWGADDPRCGAMRSVLDVAQKAHMNHRAAQTPGVCGDDCAALLKDFFRSRRTRPAKAGQTAPAQDGPAGDAASDGKGAAEPGDGLP